MNAHTEGPLEESGPPETEQLKQAFLQELGASLVTMRLKAGLSTQEAAARAGVSEELIHQVETRSTGTVTVEQLVNIALVYDRLPLDATFAEREEIQEFVAQMPGRPRTLTNFEAWKARRGVQRALALAGQNTR